MLQIRQPFSRDPEPCLRLDPADPFRAMQRASINGQTIPYDLPFDPTYGYDKEKLLSILPSEDPEGFRSLWEARYEKARNQAPHPRLVDTGQTKNGWRIYDLVFRSTDGFLLGGWAIAPSDQPVRRSFVVGHGYGGREAPDLSLPMKDAAILFPCSRGISRSSHPDLPSDPYRHVAHGIESPDRYLIGGCVEDLWVAISATIELFPETQENIGLLGVSFSGGITVLAAPWETRYTKAHVEVPTFGNQALRLQLPTTGSGAGAQAAYRKDPETVRLTLSYHDAAIAARHLSKPLHCACALFDPAVAPPGQFSIYNATPVEQRSLFTLTAGHHPYPSESEEASALLQRINTYFIDPPS